jgi:hypothetical protein
MVGTKYSPLTGMRGYEIAGITFFILLFLIGFIVVFMNGCFYFISNNFYDEFPNEGLMLNKEGKQGDCMTDHVSLHFPIKNIRFYYG